MKCERDILACFINSANASQFTHESTCDHLRHMKVLQLPLTAAPSLYGVIVERVSETSTTLRDNEGGDVSVIDPGKTHGPTDRPAAAQIQCISSRTDTEGGVLFCSFCRSLEEHK